MSRRLGLMSMIFCALLFVAPDAVLSLEPGVPLAPGVFPAVGRVAGCTATLIEDHCVLTAAHCVCKEDRQGKYRLNNFAPRTSFEFVDIFSATAPVTPVNVKIKGSVRVHPEVGAAGRLREDLAVIELDLTASQMAPGIAHYFAPWSNCY